MNALKGVVTHLFKASDSSLWLTGSFFPSYSLFQLSLQHLYLYFLPSLTFSAPPPYPLISSLSSFSFYQATELWLLQNGQLAGRPQDWPRTCVCVCVCARMCEFKRITALVCQRELASIFLSLLCIALSDSTASTAQSKKHFQSRCIKREGKGEEGGGNAMS